MLQVLHKERGIDEWTFTTFPDAHMQIGSPTRWFSVLNTWLNKMQSYLKRLNCIRSSVILAFIVPSHDIVRSMVSSVVSFSHMNNT